MTAASVDTETFEKITEGEDLPCRSCDNKATHVGTHTTCGHGPLLCTTHAIELQSWVQDPGAGLKCAHCGVIYKPNQVNDRIRDFRIERL